MVKLEPGARWSLFDPAARRTVTVLSGDGEQITYLSAIQADPGDTLELAGGSSPPLELFLIGLPPIVLPATDSEEYDLDEIPAEERDSAEKAG